MRVLRKGSLKLILLTFALAIAVGFNLAIAAFSPASALQDATTPEQQLADKYAPIVYMKEQDVECSTEGEQYLPAPVESVLGDEEVELKQLAAEGTPSDPVIMSGPTATDLAGLDETYYIDMPGNSRAPACDYEEWFDEKVETQGIPIVVYARVATEEAAPGRLALQYWFYWVFNQFNNLHESDWEMVQLNFDASDATEALETEPTDVAFAQHGGGERADWGDDKLEKEGNRIVVYPASGSHATYFTDSLWIGWGQNGSGFGCDDIRQPLDRAEPEIILMPNDPDPDGEFAWLLYDGRWGQHQDWEFNGPKGPNGGTKWTQPVTWTDGIRENSLAVPGNAYVGNGPTGFFCGIASIGGGVAAVTNMDPTYIAGLTVVVLLFVLLIAFFGWRYLFKAIPLYFRHWYIFIPISLLLIVVALIGNVIEQGLRRVPLIGTVLKTIESSSVVSAVLGFGFGSVQQLLLFTLIAPAVIHATYDLVRRDHISAEESIRVAASEFPTVIGAILWNTLIIAGLVITIVGVPIAIYKAIQWLYTPQAVIIQGAEYKEARHVSKSVVKGHWIRTLGMALLIGMVAGLPGPVVGVIALILGGLSMNVVDIISSGIYAIAYPIAVIAATLYYLTIGGFDETIDEDLALEEQPDQPAPNVAPA